MQEFGNYINGAFQPPTSGLYLETENPYTREVWARIPRSDETDVGAAVAAAKNAFEHGAWPALTASERGTMLRRLGDLISSEDNTSQLALAEVRDNGKTLNEMRNQMRSVAQWFYYYGGLADMFAGELLHTEQRNMLNYVRYEPLGVVGMVVPWNSPLRLLAWKLAPALAAGNTAVVKPSEFTSTSTLEFMRLIEEAGFPPGVVNVITGLGPEVGAPLAAHPDIAKIAFTGGSAGGQAVYLAAARNLKPVALELGGKSPNIIFEDADLDNAAKGAVAGIFGSGGQNCVAGSRLLVHRSVHDEVVERIVALAKDIILGDPMDPSTNVGPITTLPHCEKILTYIEIGKQEGARLIYGGRRAEGPGLGKGIFVEPTIFANVRNDMRIAQEEIFGPVLCVIPFENESEAVLIANDTQYGLAAGLWTRDLQRAHRVSARLQAGIVWVNTYRTASHLSPFGGHKSSGIGREGGAEMIKSYMQSKSVWIDLNDEYAYPFKR